MSSSSRPSVDADAKVWPSVCAVIATAPDDARVGVSIRDLRDGSVFNHDAGSVFPAASTIKLVILVALARAVDEGRLHLTDVASVLETQKVAGSGVLNWLQTGLELTLEDHAWLMIAISDNTASNVLIDAVGMPAIHETQESLGLGGTSLNRRFLGRLPAHGAPENVVTAEDLTTVLAAIAQDTAAGPERCAWMLRLLADQQHTDRLARHLPEGVTFAGKSGSLTRIGHDTGLLTGPGGSVAVAVLTKGLEDPYAADAFTGAIGPAVVDDFGLV